MAKMRYNWDHFSQDCESDETEVCQKKRVLPADSTLPEKSNVNVIPFVYFLLLI